MERFQDIDPNLPGKMGGFGGNRPPRRPGMGGDGGGDAFGGRVPPQNIEAEIAVLGAMMLGERGAAERASEMIARDDFYRDAHGQIFDAMLHLAEKDEPVDIITLKDELGRRGMLDAIGGIGYLMQLGEFVPTTANLQYHAQIVREKAILRRLIEAASRIAGMAYGEVDEVDTIVDMAERTIFEVARKRSAQGFMPLRPLLNEAFEQVDVAYHEKGMVTGLDTGFEDLNYMTSGFQDGDLIIVAARPSMGKTSLAVGIGQNVALKAGTDGSRKVVALFSLEMSREQLVQRMICSEARVDAHKLRTGFLQDDDWDKLARAVSRLWEANIYIDDSTDMGPLEMRAKCRRLRAEQGLDLVIVDYLQLMRGSGRTNANRNEEITEISRGLKNIAREMKVPVIALAQLSRAVERREDKRPMLSDLRDSGSIEAEADLVSFIYRPAYYERKQEIRAGDDGQGGGQNGGDNGGGGGFNGEPEGEEAEVIIAKHRNGPTGTVKVSFLARYARFDNLANRDDNPF